MPRINLNLLPDDLEDCTELFLDESQQIRSRRAPRSRKSEHAILDEIIQYSEPDPAVAETAFNPTFSSSYHEREWILNYLGPFYDRRLITDVLRQVKGGKEANVYCCEAHPDTGLELIAAKVYRPRMFRQLRNDARYRQGRPILDDGGKVLRDDRMLRAIRQGTQVGKKALHTSWMEHEFLTLQLLHEVGVDVPQPLDCGNNTILMEYIGTVEMPAPTLNRVRLSSDEAQLFFERLLHNVELMLTSCRVHGDLSAYNVLYWDGDFEIIDFPQAVDPYQHSDAWAIFQRDVERLCQYFARYGIASDPVELATDLWTRYGLVPTTLGASDLDEHTLAGLAASEST